MDLAGLIPTLTGVVALCVVSVLVLGTARIRQWWSSATAVARAAVQLGAIGLILAGVITNAVWVAVALLVMLGVAIATSSRRIGWSARHLAVVSVAIVSGAATTLLVVFLSGALAPTPRYLLAIGGIVVGNTMAITSLTARRFLQAVDEQWDQVEGWLALGAGPVDASRHLARSAVHSALVPSIDQTRTTGLVTLPGAFVGAVFGGLSPLEAGRFQVVVLAGILTAGAVAAVLVVRLLGGVTQRPVSP